MRKICSIFCLSFVLLGLSSTAGAQRQTIGRPAIDVSVLFGQTTKSPFTFVGGTAGWINHLNFGQTLVGLDVSAQPCSYHYVVDDEYDNSGNIVNPGKDEIWEFTTWDIQAGAGYYLRLLAPRSRVVILSAGVNLFAGVRYGQEISYFPKDSSDPDGDHFNRIGFVCNLVPELKFEVFPLKNASLYLSCRPKIELVSGYGGRCSWLRAFAGVGFKYYL